MYKNCYIMLKINTYFNLIINCKLCTTSIINYSNNGRFLNKILRETKSKRKWFGGDGNSSPFIYSPVHLTKGANEGKRSSNSKRVAVLNKTFMRYITDLMATGNNSAVFIGRGIEINRVMVTPDFKGVNVFWIAKGTENDNEVEQLLRQNAGSLRYELSQLRVMGVVPKLNFIKDKEYAKLIEVDQCLVKADFGDDYIPVEPSYRFKSDFSSLNSVKEEIESLNEFNVKEEIPVMRMDIFGLNHNEMILKIKKSMKKSQALHRKLDKNVTNPSGITNSQQIQYQSPKEQKVAFQQFLLKRQILQSKLKKRKEKYNSEYEYIKSENMKYDERESISDELKDDDFLEEDDKL